MCPRRPAEPGRGEVSARPRPAPSPRRAPSTVSRKRPAPAADKTIHDLVDDTIVEIMLRLPSSASLARAVLAYSRWRGLASDSSFVGRFRDCHPSSPFIGVFSNSVARPLFHPACSDVPGRDKDADLDIAAVTRKGEFLLTRLGNGQRWRLRDCRNGVLLLSGDDEDSLCVYNPLSRGQPVRIQLLPDDVTMEGEFVADCLLNGTVVSVQQREQRLAVDSFRVVSLQQRHQSREIRAVEYDSSTLQWRCHRWMSPCKKKLPKGGIIVMYAAGRIYWQYDSTLLLVLDTRTMEFMLCPLPGEAVFQDYSIGEIEDGKGYLLCIKGLDGENPNPRLQVWALELDDDEVLKLELKDEVPMSQLLSKHYSTRVCHVCTVVNGLAVLSYSRGPQFVVDLQKKIQLAMFNHFGWVYPYQMSWPPAINCGSTPPMVDNGIDLDVGSASWIQPVETDPGHDEPTVLMTGVFPSASCDRAVLEDKSETNNLPMNTTEDTEILEQQCSVKAHQSEAHDPNDEEPYGQKKKQKTNATSAVISLNNCKPTLGHLDHHIPSPSRKSTDGDERSKPSSSNRIKDAPTLSILDNTPDVNEGSGDEVEPCENHHSLKSPAMKNLSAFSGTNKFAKRHDEQSTSKRQMAANSEGRLSGFYTYNEHINHQSEAHDPDEEPYRQRKEQKTDATRAVVSLNNFKTTLGQLDHHLPSPSTNSSMGQLPTTHDKTPKKGSSNCSLKGDPPRKSRRNEAAHPKGTRRTRSSHSVHDISRVEAVTTSTPAVRQTNLRGTCRKSSIGRAATQEKPLRKGKGLLHTCSHNGCGKKFKRTTHLKEHVKSKHTQSTEPFKCQLIGCTRVFHVMHAMEVHVKSSVHYEVSTKEYKCPFGGCQSKFTWIKNLNRHVENMHKSRETPFMCRFKGCTEKFSNKHARKTHEKSEKHVEEETGKIKCHFEGCTYRCPVRQDHDRHYIKKHSKTSPSRGVSRRPRKEKT